MQPIRANRIPEAKRGTSPRFCRGLLLKKMNKCITSVEWGFGQVLAAFCYTQSPGFQRLGFVAAGQHYINATFMTNVITCLKGNITSSFFRLTPPTLVENLQHVMQ